MELNRKEAFIVCVILVGGGVFNFVSAHGNVWIGALLILLGLAAICWYILFAVKKRRESPIDQDNSAARAGAEDAARNDADFQKKQTEYNILMETITKRPPESYGIGDFNSAEVNALIPVCRRAAELAEALGPKWNKYGCRRSSSVAHLTLARLYENGEEYSNAAAVCARAIEAGFTEEETGGLVQTRLKRLIDTRAFTPTGQMRILAGESVGGFRDQMRKMFGDISEMNRISKGR